MNLLPARAASPLVDRVHHVDLFTLCDWLYEAGITVDMILCDLPYGTTACAWDEVIPFEPMWRRFKRVIKPKGAIVLTASQPFTSVLTVSNLPMFKHGWVWRKNWGSNFAVTDYQPMKEHEDILVFGKATVNYYPQPLKRNEAGLARSKYPVNPTKSKRETIGGYQETYVRHMNPENRVPSSVLEFNCERGLHPTQKPTALFEYLIRTYTRPGELVLDPCVGSGTTAEAARNTGRRYVVGDAHWKYAQVARDRMAAPYTLPMFADAA